MAKSCILVPKARDRKGEWKDSVLFTELKKNHGYEKAKETYLLIKGSRFDDLYDRRYQDGSAVSAVEKSGRKMIVCDDLAEPLYSEVMKDDMLSSAVNGFSDNELDMLGSAYVISSTEEDLRKNMMMYDDHEGKLVESTVGGKVSDATRRNIDEAEERAIKYNETNQAGNVVQIVDIYSDMDGNEKVRIQSMRRGDEANRLVSEMKGKRRLNDRLRDILSSWGVSVGTLTETERQLRINGLTDFQAARVTAEGMVEMIRLARNDDGEASLPEEFSHLAIEAMKDSPVVQRLFNFILEKNLARAIIGAEEYDDYVRRYRTQHKDSEQKSFWNNMKGIVTGNSEDSYFKTVEGDLAAQLAYEALGKIVAERILKMYGNNGHSYGDAENLVRRLSEYYSKHVGSFDINEIYSALADMERDLSTFARHVLDNTNSEEMKERIRSIDSGNVMFSLEDRIEKQKKLLGNIIENSVRRYKILQEKKKGSEDIDNMIDVKILIENYDNKQYELGVYNFMQSALENLAVLDEQLLELNDSDMPMNMKANVLRRIKNFIYSYSNAIDLINHERYAANIMIDNEQSSILTQITDLVAKMKSNYETIANPMFVQFISQFIGDSIEVPFGKMKGKVYTAKDIAQMADHDISFADRWLDSMAESGDWVLRMMDSVVKDANGRRRAKVLKFKETLDAAFTKLRAAGYSNTDFMYERDMAGNITGNYISKDKVPGLPQAQQDYYHAVMDIKRQCDLMLPEGCTTLNNVIRIRKDLIERLKSRNAKGALHETIEAVKDMFIRRSDNTEFGGEKSVLMDFEGNFVDRLPIFYIKSKENEDLNDLSTDTTTSMIMYADMCCNYHEMDNVLGELELVRDRMRKRKVQQTEGGKALKNTISAMGLNVRSDLTMEGDATNIVQRMNAWFESQVYGHYMKDEGEILGTNIDVGKTANFANLVTSLNQFALNIMAGISNILTGNVMMHIEQVAGEFFTAGDTLKADGIFTAQLPGYCADINNPVKSSKLALWNLKFNALIDYESQIRSQDYEKSRLAKLLQSDTLYFMNSVGELWLQSRCCLSMAINQKLKLNGREINLWDAYDVVEENGVKVLRQKPGVTKLDGTAFTEADEMAFTRRTKAVNQRMNGIYNYEDRCAAQAYGLGRMGLMFRKWIKTSLNRRYGNARYNFDLGAWEEGYYRTTGRFIKELGKDLKHANFTLMTRWNELTTSERANLKRAMAEVTIFITVSLIFALLTSIKKKHDDDDDDNNFTDTWFFNQMRYQVRRLEAELGAMTPSPSIIDEAFTILKSPAAAIDPMQDLLNMTKLLWPKNYFVEIKSGKYAGHSKAYKYFWDSPIVPMHNTIYRGLHPENSVNFFGND